MTTREEFIRDLRQLADFLTVNPDVSVPAGTTHVQLSDACGSDEAKIRYVDAFAMASGAEPVWNRAGTQYMAELRFGSISFYAVACTSASMAEFNEERRLGREVLKRQRAAAAANVIDGEVVESLPLLPVEEPRRSRGWLVDA